MQRCARYPFSTEMCELVSGQSSEKNYVAVDALSSLFSRLKTGNQSVVVTPRVPKACVDKLYENLEGIDSKYKSLIRLKEHEKQVPDMVAFISEHCVITPYSLSIQKCLNPAYCNALCTPDQYRELAMQR